MFIHLYSQIKFMGNIRRKLDIQQVQRVAEILKTIGHPVRLQILEILEENEPLSVTDIQLKIDGAVEQSLLSHHLIKMKDKGLLRCEKIGMNVYYKIEDRNLLKIFDCMQNCQLV